MSCTCRCVFERMMDVTIDMRRGESFLRAARYFRINLEAVYVETRKREEFVSASRTGGRRKEKIGKGREKDADSFAYKLQFTM